MRITHNENNSQYCSLCVHLNENKAGIWKSDEGAFIPVFSKAVKKTLSRRPVLVSHYGQPLLVGCASSIFSYHICGGPIVPTFT